MVVETCLVNHCIPRAQSQKHNDRLRNGTCSYFSLIVKNIYLANDQNLISAPKPALVTTYIIFGATFRYPSCICHVPNLLCTLDIVLLILLVDEMLTGRERVSVIMWGYSQLVPTDAIPLIYVLSTALPAVCPS